MGKKKGLTKASINKKELRQMAMECLEKNPGVRFNLKKFFRTLELTAHPVRMLCVDVLNELVDEGLVTVHDEGEFSYSPQVSVVEGTFSRTSGGRNFVDTDDGVGISVYDEDTMHALPGDRVRVSVFAQKRGKSKLHGQVIEIVKRSERPFIGTLQIQHNVAFLTQPSGQLQSDILIPERFLKGGVNGDKAAVRIVEWPARARNPIGEVIEVLGKGGENETEMHAILAEFGLPYSYPKDVEDAANLIDSGITPAEIAKREDCRDTLTFTIDPRDAKDFDDALSIRELKEYSNSKNSRVWEVGVHIADVSHYVEEGGIIDKEAVRRATSIYLVDRTIPMLPEHLCNGICSLRPDEEKLTYSVIFDMNEDAEVLNYRIRHTVIKSNRRYTYEEVQRVLEDRGEASECEAIRKGEALPTEPIPAAEVTADTVQPAAETYAEELIILNRLAHKLRDVRFHCGAINFDREEVRFEIDEKGKPVSVYFKRAKDANKLVEEFMLLANRTVAESVGKCFGPDSKDSRAFKGKNPQPKVLPYRIHDLPDPTKLDNLAQMAARMGYMLRTQGRREEIADSINTLLKDVKGQRMENLIETVTLRAMQKARYSTDNIGHYGLAFDYYTHFTSPIRRYPDLMVHRLLTLYEDENARSASKKKYEQLCEHSSAQEILSELAERASIRYKQVEFMSDKLGEEFDAHISGVKDYGIYCEVDENKCEGLIPVRFLGDEGFDYDERNFCLVGRQTHHRFTLGDAIRIKVASANLFRKQLDFDFVKKLADDQPEQATASPFYMNLKAPRKPAGKKNKRKGRR